MDIYNVYIFTGWTYNLQVDWAANSKFIFPVILGLECLSQEVKKKKIVISSDGMLKIRPCFFKTNHSLSWLKFN